MRKIDFEKYIFIFEKIYFFTKSRTEITSKIQYEKRNNFIFTLNEARVPCTAHTFINIQIPPNTVK